MGIEALAFVTKGIETLTKAPVDPEKAGKSAAELLLVGALAKSAKPLNEVSFNSSTGVDFRSKFLNQKA